MQPFRSAALNDLTPIPEPNLTRLAGMVLADEDPNDLAEIVRALFAELQPKTYLERRELELAALCDFCIDRNYRRVPAVERKMVDEIIRRDYARQMHLAALKGEDFTPPNLAAEAYLRAEGIYSDLAREIWQLERARALHIAHFHEMARERQAREASGAAS